MELRRSENEGLTRLGELWKTTPGAELEAMLSGMELTAWQDVIQYLRSLGMRENPQIVKLNICLSNNIRFTLEGAGVIQAYCRDNRIAGKPFVAMLKENIADAEPVSLGSYSARAKLKREVPLAADDERVKDALARWDQLGKHFRNIQRFEFVAPGGMPVRFDVSIVRENAGRPARTFQEARVTAAPAHYEAEVEVVAGRDSTDGATAVRHLLRGLSWLLQGRQRSFVLVSAMSADIVRDALSQIFGFAGSNRNGSNSSGNRNRAGPTTGFRFPGPQPATLERRHIVADSAEPGLRNTPGGYNVTDKADGLRCLLYVSDNGRIFLVDGGGRVYATGKQTEKSLSGLVLDGEWIRRDKRGSTVSHYYAFDILAAAGGDSGVAKLPFMIAGTMYGSASAANTRNAVMSDAVGVLGRAVQTVRSVPAAQNLQIGMKSFRAAAPGDAIFRECAAATLEDAKSALYNTDGLIFTPNAAPLPLGRGTWDAQLKWKPAHENTIDFLVIVDKERGKDGVPTAVDAIGTKYREDAGQTVRYKTLRLFVGSNRDAAFADPRHTVTDATALLPASLETGEWREVEFRPTEPRDPMASICYVAIGEGGMDPAGATAAATALDVDTDLIRTTRTGDILQDDMIVEMAYHPERAPGWRWEPVRVRHDKTERWLQGRRSGTMNADWVANSIWTTLHNPVTEEAVRTGVVLPCSPVAALPEREGGGRRRAVPTRDGQRTQCMLNFHNDYIKRKILLRSQLLSGAALCDMGMGRGEDLSRWISGGVGYVLGCDAAASNINDPADGAYRRLLDKMVALGGRDTVPPMVFVQGDMARPLRTGEAAAGSEDRDALVAEFAGRAAGGFDVVSCMFALHYMFRDDATLSGFLTNLADVLKVGGYFVGCGPDGDAVARLMASVAASDDGGNMAVGREGSRELWSITRRYGSGIGASVPPSAAGLGLAVDVDFSGVGESYSEYLVSWSYLQARLAEAGLELLDADELARLGLPASSQMFGDTWSAAGEKYEMAESLRQLSFLNRWWVFRRRTDRRPAPPMATPLPVSALTEPLRLPAERPPSGVEEYKSGVEESKSGVEWPQSGVEESKSGEFDVIPLAEPVNKQFIVNPATKEPDGRLGPDLSDWPRYMSLGTLVDLTDRTDETVHYPSIEAAVASAKYQIASNQRDNGPVLFGVNGAIHRKFEEDRRRLREADATPEAFAITVDNEVAAMRVASGKAKMSKAGWDAAAWDAGKMDIYEAYLAQRYAKDARFRAMVNAIGALGGEILFANGTEYNELGVGVRVDGSVVGGDNKIGRAMMALAGTIPDVD